MDFVTHPAAGLWGRACFGPLAAGLMFGGSALSAIGDIQAGQAAQAAGRYNSEVYKNDAIQATQAADAQAVAQQTQTGINLGKQKAGYAASGVDVASGSPVDVMTDTAAKGTLDALTLRYGGQVRAQAYNNAGILARYQGDQAAISDDIGAGSSLLTGAAKAASLLPASGTS